MILKQIKKNNNLKKVTIITLFIVSSLLPFFSLKLGKDFGTELQKSDFNNPPRTSDTVTLNFGYYLALNSYTSKKIEWSFESSKNYIGITVLVMDSNNFNKYKNKYPCSYKIESDGCLAKDSGTYSVEYGDQWYLIFLNADFDKESTELRYSAKFDSGSFGSSLLSLMTIGIIVLGSIIGLISIVLIIRKRRKREINWEDF